MSRIEDRLSALSKSYPLENMISDHFIHWYDFNATIHDAVQNVFDVRVRESIPEYSDIYTMPYIDEYAFMELYAIKYVLYIQHFEMSDIEYSVFESATKSESYARLVDYYNHRTSVYNAYLDTCVSLIIDYTYFLNQKPV